MRLAIAAQKFNLTIEGKTYDEAFESSTKALLKAAKNKGYATVFFDKALLTNASGTQPYYAEAKKQVYATLVKIDGTNFASSLPHDLKLSDEA